MSQPPPDAVSFVQGEERPPILGRRHLDGLSQGPRQDGRQTRGNPWWRAMALAVIVACVSWPSIGDWSHLSPDGITYLTTARFLVETGDFPHHPLIAPPGFPLVLMPFVYQRDFPFLWLRLFFAGCWIATSVLTYLWHREELGEWGAWGAGFLIATSSVFLTLTTYPLSEHVFVPLSLLALLLFKRWRQGTSLRWPLFLLGVAVCATAILVRSIGVLLLPVGVYAIVRGSTGGAGRFGRLAPFLILTISPIFLWHQRQSTYPDYQGYSHTLSGSLMREQTAAQGIALYGDRLKQYGYLRLRGIKEALLPADLCWRLFNPPWEMPTTWLIGGGTLFLGLIHFAKRRSLADVYAFATLAVLAVWPWDEGVRFIMPLMPILVGYPLWAAQSWACRRPARRWPFRLVATTGAFWLLIHAGGTLLVENRMPAQEAKARHRSSEMRDLGAWLERNTAQSSRLLGVIPDKNEGKLLLAGGAYLARRNLQTLDIDDGTAPALEMADADQIFVHLALWPEKVKVSGWRESDQCHGFAVLRPAGPLMPR